jgi:hypothetical protein
LAEDDLIDAFFHELTHRGYDPLLARLCTVGRFEACDRGRTDQWTVTVRDGRASMTPEERNIGWVMRADRSVFKQLMRGEVSALESLMRGALSLTLIDEGQRFSLLTRLFAGAPATRGRPGPLVEDEHAHPSGPRDGHLSAQPSERPA